MARATAAVDGAALIKLARARRYAASGDARTIRTANDLSIAEMAEAIGVDESTVCRWELGMRRPGGDAAVQWVDLLDRLQKTARRAVA